MGAGEDDGPVAADIQAAPMRGLPSRPSAARGVLWAVREAMAAGFTPGDPDWVNLGQGQPELGPLPGAPARVTSIDLGPADHAYGPVTGLSSLREGVAAHMNRQFRRGRAPYAAANVAVAGGGRLALSRLLAALAPGRVGHATPDYPAIDDALRRAAGRLEPVRVEGRLEDGFLTRPEVVERHMAAGLDAFVLSHPNNPTGSRYGAEDLGRLVAGARRHGTLLVLDEFYGQYVYDGDDGTPGGGRAVSGAAHVVEVDRDPVVLIDGVTKAFRYPGWRIAWMVGPRAVVEAVANVGGGLDGGPSVPAQRATLALLDPAAADAEAEAVRTAFRAKRDLVTRGLADLGLRVLPTAGTFYAFADLGGLPPALRDADAFFRAALRERVVTVPGRLFDIDPAQVRTGPSPFRHWLRFAFGPPRDALEEGIRRLARVVERGGA